MMMIIAVLTLAGGYLAGRLHGKAAHHRFLARGFRIMAAAARRDGTHAMSIYDLAARPIDVSNAFGRQEDINGQVHVHDAARSVRVEINAFDRATAAFKAAGDAIRRMEK